MSDLTFIGTSDAFGAGGRRQSAILLRAPQGAVLLDCGATTNSGMAELGIDRGEVDAILVSHFHSDHFGGIPLFLLAAQYVDARDTPLVIAGPPGIEARVSALARAMGHPLDDRSRTFPVRFAELHAGVETEIGPVRVRTFETHHQPDACPHGMILRAGSHRIAYSGDTGWFDGLPEAIAGAEVFVCECTLAQPVFEYHLDHETLVERRDQFDCGRLILTHLGEQMTHRRNHCDFETADDGLTISI